MVLFAMPTTVELLQLTGVESWGCPNFSSVSQKLGPVCNWGIMSQAWLRPHKQQQTTGQLIVWRTHHSIWWVLWHWVSNPWRNGCTHGGVCLFWEDMMHWNEYWGSCWMRGNKRLCWDVLQDNQEAVCIFLYCWFYSFACLLAMMLNAMRTLRSTSLG